MNKNLNKVIASLLGILAFTTPLNSVVLANKTTDTVSSQNVRMSTKKKVAIGTGIAIGVPTVGAILFGLGKLIFGDNLDRSQNTTEPAFNSIIKLNDESKIKSLRLIFGHESYIHDFEECFKHYKQTGNIISSYFSKYKIGNIRYNGSTGAAEIGISSFGSSYEMRCPLDIAPNDINACITMLKNARPPTTPPVQPTQPLPTLPLSSPPPVQKTEHFSSDFSVLPEKLRSALQNDYDEIQEKMIKQSTTIYQNLSTEEKEAIRNYSGLNRITSWLLEPEIFSREESDSSSRYVELLSGLIQRNRLSEDMTFFRGHNLHCFKYLIAPQNLSEISNDGETIELELAKKNLEGKILQNNTLFTSTSISPKVALSFAHSHGRQGKDCEIGVLFIIHASKGTPYLPLINISSCNSEKEVLFDRNIKLKVNRVNYVPESYYFGRSSGMQGLVLDCEIIP